jgi:hypothetical protein
MHFQHAGNFVVGGGIARLNVDGIISITMSWIMSASGSVSRNTGQRRVVSRPRFSTAASAVFAIIAVIVTVTMIGIVVFFLHEDTLFGDGREDTGSDTRALPAQQKLVNVSENPTGVTRNDELKIRHLNEIHPC